MIISYLNHGILESSSPSAFSPSDIAGLKLWLKADAITGLSDGDSVASWSDSSGNSNDAVQATTANKPTYKTGIINSLPVVRFDDTDDYIVTPSISWTNQTIFVVLKGTGGGYPVGFTTGSENAVIYGFVANTLEIYNGPRIQIGNFSSFAYATIIRNSSGTTTVRKNGTQTGTSASVNIPAASVVKLGVSGSLTDPWGGDIAELLIYDAVISGDDLTNVETYLADKYGL